MKKKIYAISTICLLGATSSALANIIMVGDYVQTQISNDGTLGNGSSTPGLQYDPTGAGAFDPNLDYVAPGTPFEGFGLRYEGSGLLENRNSSSNGEVGGAEDFLLTSLTDLSSSSTYDNFVSWMGSARNGSMSIQHDFFFNNDDERINITTSITADIDLVGLKFARAVDPDPDSFSGGSSATVNQRGIDNNNDGDALDSGDVAAENFVGSVGAISGQPLGLYADTDFLQNTGIVFSCCSVTDPLTYLAGGNTSSSTGDDGIGIAFELGDLLSGESVSVNYAYVMGGSLATIDIPDDPATGVPGPSGIALFGIALLGFCRKLKSK